MGKYLAIFCGAFWVLCWLFVAVKMLDGQCKDRERIEGGEPKEINGWRPADCCHCHDWKPMPCKPCGCTNHYCYICKPVWIPVKYEKGVRNED